MDRYLKWEQPTLTQQLNCVCNTLAKKSITTAIIQGYNDRQSQLLPNKDGALIIGAIKSLATSRLPCGTMQAKRRQGNIWQIAKRISGQMNVSTQWTGNTWNWLSRTRQICTGYGGLSKFQVSAVQGFKLAATTVIWFLTSNALTVEDARLQHTLCSPRMTTALDYWSKMLMNWQRGCYKITKWTQRFCIGFPNTSSWGVTNLSPRWGSCPLSSRHLLKVKTSSGGGISQKVTSQHTSTQYSHFTLQRPAVI